MTAPTELHVVTRPMPEVDDELVSAIESLLRQGDIILDVPIRLAVSYDHPN